MLWMKQRIIKFQMTSLTSEEDQVNQDPSDSDVDSMGDPFSDEDSEDQDEEDWAHKLLCYCFLSCIHVSCMCSWFTDSVNWVWWALIELGGRLHGSVAT